jgi:hypothetical protein
MRWEDDYEFYRLIIWKENVVTNFNELPLHSTGETEEIQAKSQNT